MEVVDRRGKLMSDASCQVLTNDKFTLMEEREEVTTY